MEKLRGKFITFEGGEGAGKTTQSRLLVEHMNKAGVGAVWTREPGGCEGAEEIRNLVLKGSVDRWDGITELLLIYASRKVHTERKIKPALASGMAVVSDRYFDSSLAYQGFGHGLAIHKVDAVRKIVLDDFRPDLTILLDVDISLGLSRACAGTGKNRFEDMDMEFHRRVRNGFDHIYETNRNRCIRIDTANLSIEDLSKQIVDRVLEFFAPGTVKRAP
ncbi:MAG: dTMP kinase [Rickettsiales bacterium]|jgi:dTMP kinase|nr:dTMP kinase [Rickettsiales bacterium]